MELTTKLSRLLMRLGHLLGWKHSYGWMQELLCFPATEIAPALQDMPDEQAPQYRALILCGDHSTHLPPSQQHHHTHNCLPEAPLSKRVPQTHEHARLIYDRHRRNVFLHTCPHSWAFVLNCPLRLGQPTFLCVQCITWKRERVLLTLNIYIVSFIEILIIYMTLQPLVSIKNLI